MSSTIDDLALCLDSLEVRYLRFDTDSIEACWMTDALEYRVLFLDHGPLLTVVVPRVIKVPARRLSEVVQFANRLNARSIH